MAHTAPHTDEGLVQMSRFPSSACPCLRRVVANRLDVVAVRVDYERPVIVGMIFLSHPRSTVVASTGSQCGLVERIDDLAIGGGEGHVHGFERRSLGDPEIRFARSESGGTAEFH